MPPPPPSLPLGVRGAAKRWKIKGWVVSCGPVSNVPIWEMLLLELGREGRKVVWIKVLCRYTLPRRMPFFFFALSIWNVCLTRIFTLGRMHRIRVTPIRHLQSLGPPVLTALALMLVPLAYPDFSGLTILSTFSAL